MTHAINSSTPSSDKGAFITFEGGEASGKSTQIPLLAAALKQRGYDVITTREPGGDALCERIRELLLSREIRPLTEVLLFAANRYEHSCNVIIPAINSGKIVLCDRFMDSSMAYQGYGLDMPLSLLKTLQDYVVPLPPSLTFIIDLDPHVAQKRLQARGKTNHMDKRVLEFHERVRKGYTAIVQENPERCVMIEGNQNEQDIHHRLLSLTLDHLKALVPLVI